MPDAPAILEDRLQRAYDQVLPGADPVLRVSDRADYQSNGALPLAKQLSQAPRELAQQIVDLASLDDLCERVEVSGPGFINLDLSGSFIGELLSTMTIDGRLGLATTPHPETVIIDYSAPNVAKEMHVGHLRTTIIGDALCRLYEAVGHRVIRENHIGDWGTPFGMLIEHILDLQGGQPPEDLTVTDLDTFYRDARASFDASEDFRERSRRRVVLLQQGDAETMRLWRMFVAESDRHFQEVYRRLGVLLTPGDIVGESFYNPMLKKVIEDLDVKGLLVEDAGARCVFPPGFVNRDGDPLPLIVQKSDGGYTYATTDLAALRDRVDRLGADQILYVVGAPQAQHLEMCFAVAELAGWLGTHRPVHVSFGNVLGPDRKLLRTRAGTSIKLAELLDEAVERAKASISEREDAGTQLPVDLAEQVGVGAVKYADLSTDRNRDYVFDWERMLALDGNTGPYLQYAHARICSLYRRAAEEGLIDGVDPGGPHPSTTMKGLVPRLTTPEERALGLQLTGYAAVVRAALASYNPSRLSGYLYELATTFTTFYEHCPVLRASDDALRRERLFLSSLTAEVLAQGLALLGIAAPERM